LDFFEKIERQLPGFEKLAIRQMLKQGDQDLVVSIPKSLTSTWEGDYQSLAQRINELSDQKKTFENEIKKLSTLLSDIPASDQIDLDKLRLLQGAAAKLHQTGTALDANESVRALLGGRFAGSQTVEEDLEPELSIAKAVLPAVDQWVDIINDLIGRGDVESFRSKLGEFLNTSDKATSLLSSLLGVTGQSEIHFRENRNNSVIAEFLEQAVENSAELYEQSAFATALEAYASVGHSDLIRICRNTSTDLSHIPNITEALVARSLAKRVYRDFGPVLGRFQGTLLDDLRRKFADADRKIITSTRQMLRQKIKGSALPPPGNRRGKKSEWTEYALIEHEISKKARFVPVRDLTKRAGIALQELKPCWMMSPLAVAQYIPKGTVEFDLCIIDEASQMPPEDAFGALVRSKQTMIVGDTNQLPPTSFFRKMIDEGDADEDETILDESILQLANAAFRPKRRLRWHYRSRHSGLIKFSNRLVYDDDLIVFPSAYEDRKDMGVSLVNVDGFYKSGVNGPEVQSMVNAALDFMEQSPHRSLGIVTLNQKQRDLLIEEMEYALRNRKKATDYINHWNNKDDGIESFFIKNLENVQGDERDVIFIGTVYGPAELGAPVMQRFGPINGLAGKRRLNVLFSRAKEQVVTFSSMTGEDIRADESGNPGTYMLKRWLEYSATGVLDGGQLTHKEPDSDFEVFVIEQIEAMGCEAVPQVGVAGYFIDIGVKHPDWPHGFVLGVECDGASYHSSKSARDRDRLRQEVLEGLGWRFHRIWSTDWFNDPLSEVVRLREAITQCVSELKQKANNFSTETPETPTTQEHEPFDRDIFEQVSDDKEKSSELKDYGLNDGICAGDTVFVSYLNEPEKEIKVTVSEKINDPSRGIIRSSEPLAEALLGAEEGEEVDVLIGSYLRRAVVKKVERADDEGGNNASASSRHKPPSEPAKLELGPTPKPVHSAARETSQDVEVSEHESADSNFFRSSLELDPTAFYDEGYQSILRDLGVELIDKIGPITHKHLCEKIARMHGFQRTGSKIRKTIWRAVHKQRELQQDPRGTNIFWPDHQAPQELLTFRGLEVAGEKRTWKQVPYPEKMSLALEIVANKNTSDRIRQFSERIGIERLMAGTKDELEKLIQVAEGMHEKN
jgi:very-short-patch-repair endonuclease